MANWVAVPNMCGTNYVLQGDDFFISYNPSPTSGLMPLFDSDDGESETALRAPDGEYFILNGDFREAYERLFSEGYNACKRFYDQQSAHSQSSWSSDSAELPSAWSRTFQ